MKLVCFLNGAMGLIFEMMLTGHFVSTKTSLKKEKTLEPSVRIRRTKVLHGPSWEEQEGSEISRWLFAALT